MNMQLREADMRTRAATARPPWWVHPFRRRAVILTSLAVTAGLAIAAAVFWVWYTTLCGSCASPF